MNKKRLLLCGVLAFTIVFTACGKKSAGTIPGDAAGSPSINQSEAKPSMQDNASMNGVSKKADTDLKANTTSTEISKDQKIIRNGSINIVEENLIKLAEGIKQKTKELGGYIENEEMMEYRLTASVRIPADRFDDFIQYAEKGFDVKNKSISSQNITDTYVDNEARLNNLKAQEKQILGILEKAKTVEEVLKVQAELYKIRGEAEALEGRKRNWDKQIDYATLIINADKKQIVPDNKKTIISGSDFIKAIGKGFSNTGVSLILFVEQLFIFIFSNIIVLVIIGVLSILGFKRFKKYNKNNKL